MKRGMFLAVVLILVGCAGRTPRAALPQIGAPPYCEHGECRCVNDHYVFNALTGQCELNAVTVPGHPDLHFGPEHWQCDAQNNCELVRNWLDKDGKPVLTPLGCFLAKTRLTWIFGDQVSMCEKEATPILTPIRFQQGEKPNVAHSPTEPELSFSELGIGTQLAMVADTNGKMELILGCATAGSDPEDIYDCKLAPGHTLTEAVRLMGRTYNQQSEMCEAERRRILERWKKSLEDIQKALKKQSYPKENGGKS